MDLASILPPPKYSFRSIDSDLTNPTTNDPNSHIQFYRSRQGYVPRDPEHFGDGGAFPEIHIKQYPLDMGRKNNNNNNSNSRGTVALHVDSNGEVRYDAILRQGRTKEQIVQSQYKDLLPQNNIATNELARPTDEEIAENTEETVKALEKITQTKLAATRPTNRTLTGETGRSNNNTFIRYTPHSGHSRGLRNSGAKQRLIKHNKLPRPPSPPVPIITAEEQKYWKNDNKLPNLPCAVANARVQKKQKQPKNLKELKSLPKTRNNEEDIDKEEEDIDHDIDIDIERGLNKQTLLYRQISCMINGICNDDDTNNNNNKNHNGCNSRNEDRNNGDNNENNNPNIGYSFGNNSKDKKRKLDNGENSEMENSEPPNKKPKLAVCPNYNYYFNINNVVIDTLVSNTNNSNSNHRSHNSNNSNNNNINGNGNRIYANATPRERESDDETKIEEASVTLMKIGLKHLGKRISGWFWNT